MKKLLSMLISATMVVSMVPSLAFAGTNDATKTWEQNGKFMVELQSGQTKATATVYDDYSVNAIVNGSKVAASEVKATAKMKNVASLGVTNERSHEITLKTGLTQTPDLKDWFKNLYAFDKGATVNGKVDGKDFQYTISKFEQKSEGNHGLTASPNDVNKVRSAWQALAGKVSTKTATDDSQIKVIKGTYLQIGNEKLTFDNDCLVNPNSQNGGADTEKAIRDAASLKTDATPAKTNVEMYLAKGSVLQIGGSIATLNTSLYIRSDVKTSIENPLASLRSDDSLYKILFDLVTLTDNLIGSVNGNTVAVDVLSECVVNVDGTSSSYAYGDTVKLEPEDGKIWKNDKGETVSGTVVVTEDVTFHKEDAPVIPSTPSTAPTPEKKEPVVNMGNAGSDDAKTNVDLAEKTTTTDGKTDSVVDNELADKIVEKAVENNSKEVFVDAATAKGDSAESNVVLPAAAVKDISEKTQASVTVNTDNATVSLDKKAVDAVAEKAGTTGDVKLVVQTKEVKDNKVVVELKIETANGEVHDFKGGIATVTVPVHKDMKDKELVAVYIDENGKYIILDGKKNADGTFTFTTGHFSTYAVMTKADADAAVEAQKIENAEVSGIVAKTYTGKEITQDVVVTLGDKTLTAGTDYDVTYENNVKVGLASVKIAGKGKYEGEITKTFKINPKSVALTSVKAQKKALKATWKKSANKVTGYQVRYSTSSKFKTYKTVSVKYTKKVNSKVVKNLKSNKRYYVKVRTYTKTADGTYYSVWSKAKSAKVK